MSTVRAPGRPSLHIFVCVNERAADNPLPACAPRGGREVLDAFKRAVAARADSAQRVKVTPTGCLTPCQCGPNVVIYPDNVWYAGVTVSDVSEILDAHLTHGRPVARLLLPDDVRVV